MCAYSLYLPLASGARLAKRSRNQALSPTSGATVILLVEEEPLIRELSRDMLERQGFEVLTAATIAEAKRIAAAGEEFHVLITARTSEDIAGLRPGLRILFISGYSDDAPDLIPLPENAAILQKPFSGETLAGKVRELLEQKPKPPQNNLFGVRYVPCYVPMGRRLTSTRPALANAQ